MHVERVEYVARPKACLGCRPTRKDVRGRDELFLVGPDDPVEASRTHGANSRIGCDKRKPRPVKRNASNRDERHQRQQERQRDRYILPASQRKSVT